MCEQVQQATGNTVKLAWADQGYTGEQARSDAAENGIELQVVKLPEAKKGFVLLPRRWVVEMSQKYLFANSHSAKQRPFHIFFSASRIGRSLGLFSTCASNATGTSITAWLSQPMSAGLPPMRSPKK